MKVRLLDIAHALADEQQFGIADVDVPDELLAHGPQTVQRFLRRDTHLAKEAP